MPANACGCADGIDGDLDVAVGPVLEADRHRQARAELAVDLALGRARADRAPADGIGDVLRGDRIEELEADRQPGAEHPEQHVAGAPEALVDVARAVEVGVVDQPLPACRRPGLLEVHPHRDQQVLFVRVGEGAQAPRVVERGLEVVDAARAHDDQQPVVLAVEHRVHALAAVQHDARLLLRQRQLFEQAVRGDKRLDPLDPLVADCVRGAGGRHSHRIRPSSAAARTRSA
jgi:hypothetical protein